MRGQSEVYHLPAVEEDDKLGRATKPDSKANLIRQSVEAQAFAGTVKTRRTVSTPIKTSLKQVQLPAVPIPRDRLFENR
jgi:hypothetical protein